ncbi:MAG: hypothetical protein ACOVRK_08845 [Chryseobacterium taeanense]
MRRSGTSLGFGTVATAGIADGAVTTAKIQGSSTNGQVLTTNASGVTSWATPVDNNTTYTGSTSINLNGTSFERTALTGDVTAAANSNATSVVGIQGRSISNTAPANGQVLGWNGSIWVPTNSDTTNDAWINDTTNGLVKLGTKADGTARTAGSDIVMKDNGSIGIGTATPAAALDVNSTVGTFVAPRMSTTQRDALVLPPKGSLIYNLDVNKYEVNMGTNASPFWDQLNTATTPIALKGSFVDTPSNLGDTSPVIAIDNLKFRVTNANSGNINGTVANIQLSTASGSLNATWRYLWGYNAANYYSDGNVTNATTSWQTFINFSVRDVSSYIQGVLTDVTNKTMYRFTFYVCGAGKCGSSNVISFVVEKII